MYVKPPGMAAQEHAASHQAQQSQGQNAAQQQQQQGQPAQEAEAPKRRHGPKEQWERGQGAHVIVELYLLLMACESAAALCSLGYSGSEVRHCSDCVHASVPSFHVCSTESRGRLELGSCLISDIACKPASKLGARTGTANALQLSGTLKRRRNSPPIGGFEWGSGNQELLLDDDDGDVGGQLGLPPAATVCENHEAGGTGDGVHGKRSKHKSRHDKIKRTKTRSEHNREDADTDSKHAKRHKRKHDSKHTRRRAHNDSGSSSSGSSHDSPHAGACASHPQESFPVKSPGGQRHRRSGSRGRQQARVQAHRCQHHAGRSAGQRHDRLEDALQALVAEGYDLESLLKDR